MSDLEKLMVVADLQLKVGGCDAYNLGLYNGILTCVAMLAGRETRLLKIDEFETLQKQIQALEFNQ